LVVGSHSITAAYSGDTTFVPSTSSALTQLVSPACTGECISVGDQSMLEGNSGTRTMTFPVTLSRPATTIVTVNYAVTGVTATGGTKAGAGIDFKLKSGTVTFTPNAKTGKTPITKTITVTIFGDTTTELDQTFAVTLSNPSPGNVLGRSVGTGTILNDDGITSNITMGVGDASVVGATSGSQNLRFAVTLSAKATVGVNYTIAAGTATYTTKATGGGDFGGKVSGTINFTSTGGTLKMISIPIWPDLNPDANETFTITLSGLNGAGVTLIRATATGTILSLS
jgi:serralysin